MKNRVQAEMKKGGVAERLTRRAALIGLIVIGTALPLAIRAQVPERSIVLASTTSVDNSGLLGRILPVFTRNTGIQVRVLAQGTGQALATAAHGDADLVLVHDPDAEDRFMRDGHGLERHEIAWNDFIVVGPSADPAHIVGGHDAVAALRAIDAAQVPFVSRGDKSGTDALEKRLWKLAGLQPQGSWYRDIGGGMGAALNAAAAMNAYTISDRGTWLAYSNKLALTVLLEGDPRLINRYDVILLNPRRHPNARHELARMLADWLSSTEGQAAIGAYQVGGTQLFHPDAGSH
jgi:tungstate transport system substrate-binding protein